MDLQSIAKVSPKGHLPEELCRDILSRLPVKYLLRFCCVSKSWLSLIKDPDFHRLHLQNLKNNHDETHLLVVEGASRDCVVRCSNTLEKTTGTLLTLGNYYGDERYWWINCLLDGLVLVESIDGLLRIWNPSIRKFHDIPPSPKIETFLDFRETVIGLAYDALVEDYKCVKIVHGNSHQPPLVVVYTLGAGSWKIIPFQVKEGVSISFNYLPCWEAVYLRGNLYFVAGDGEWEAPEVVWFDVSKEVFCSINLPEADVNWFDVNWFEKPGRLVHNGCSSLALTLCSDDSLTMWVFETKSMCWSERYKRLTLPKYFYLMKNGCDILMWGFSDNAYHVNTPAGKSLPLHLRLVSSYNLETKEEKILLVQSNKKEVDRIPEFVCGHTESFGSP